MGLIDDLEGLAHDIESLASKAFDELESLGIAIGEGVAWLVKYLIQAGEDPISVISHLSSRISSMGGDVTRTLEDLASGIMNDGLMGFAKKKVNQVVTPLQDTLQASTARSQSVADVHRTTLSVMQTKLTALQTGAGSSSAAWQGPGVEQMSLSFGDVSGLVDGLTVPMEGGGAQAQLNQICEQALVDIAIIGSIVVVLEIIVVAIVAVAGLVTGPGEVVVLGIDGAAGAALIGSTLEIIAFLIGADLLAWLLGSLAIYVVQEVQGLSIHHMSKGGNRNVGDTGIENEARALIAAGTAASMCEALAILWDEATRAKDAKRRERIKATQKKHNCRHRGGH